MRYQVVATAAQELGLKVPSDVKKAQAFYDAATAALSAAERPAGPPSPPDDPDGIAAYIEAVASFDPTAPERARLAARSLVGSADETLGMAWAAAMGGLESSFSKAFDEAADSFTKAMSTLGGVLDARQAIGGHADDYNTAVKAIATMDLLRPVRDAYASLSKADIGNATAEQVSRVCVVDSVAMAYRVKGAVYDWPKMLAVCLGLGWQTAADQEAMFGRQAA